MKKLFFILIVFASCKTTKMNTDCKGETVTDCICTMEFKPVCGCDGKTYSNACQARCAGVKSWTEGECIK